MWKRFKKHKIALTGLVLLFLLIIPVVFAEFFAPYGLNETSSNSYAAPTRIRFTDEKGKFSLKPFVYDAQPSFDLNTGQTFWKEDTTSPHYLRLFIHGSAYSILGLKLDIHLFGAEGGHVFIMGTDALGRDVFSRLLYGGRVSLAIAFITALFALIAGSLAGIVSGFFGGVADMIIQRVIELFITIPNIPLGLALAAFLPPNLNPILLIAAISLVIALVMWANIARQVRGKTLPLRDAVHVQAAVALGASTPRVLLKPYIPSNIFPSHRRGNARNPTSDARGSGTQLSWIRRAPSSDKLGSLAPRRAKFSNNFSLPLGGSSRTGLSPSPFCSSIL